MTMKIFWKSIFCIFLAFFVFVSVAFAQGGSGGTVGAGATGGTGPRGTSITLPNPLACASPAGTTAQTPVECVLNKIIDVLLILAAPIVTIMVLVGAFQILTAAGDPEKFSTGRRTILYALVGFAIILLAKGIVIIITNFITTP